MRVCFVTANYPPEARGGTEQVVVALAHELRELGAEVAAVSGSDVPHAGADAAEERYDGVSVHRLFRTPAEHDRHGYVRPRLLALLRDRLSTLRPDVVHVHSFAGLGLGVAEVCGDLGVPVVATFHDLWATCARFFRVPAGGVSCPTGTDRTACVTCVNDALQTDVDFVRAALAARDQGMREEVARLAACTAPSTTAADFVHRCLPFAGKIDVIGHGLLRAIPAEHAAPAPSAGAPLRIGTYGGLVPEKGLRELVVASSGLGCELHLSGPFHDSVFEAEIHALAAAQGTALVCHGAFSPADRHPARDLHLAVFPSKCQETYGLVVDEALGHRVPTVVSDAGALRERATTPGVEVTSLEALAQVLRELVGSPARLAALRAAIPATLPTIAAAAARHLELYRTLR